MSSICLAITRSPRLDATEQSCRDRARRMSVEASCGFDRGDSCRPPIVLVSARPRSNIRAVWHLDEFVVANVRAGPRVHVFPADFTVRQTVILGHGLVVPDFIYCPAVRAFKSFRHLKKYTLVRCWLPDGLLMVCNRRYPSAPALGRRAQARRGALPGQGLTHLFSSGRGVCNARGLRASGGGADQIRDPATGQPVSAEQDRLSAHAPRRTTSAPCAPVPCQFQLSGRTCGEPRPLYYLPNGRGRHRTAKCSKRFCGSTRNCGRSRHRRHREKLDVVHSREPTEGARPNARENGQIRPSSRRSGYPK